MESDVHYDGSISVRLPIGQSIEKASVEGALPDDLVKFIVPRLVLLQAYREKKEYAKADSLKNALERDILLYWFADLSSYFIEEDLTILRDRTELSFSKEGIAKLKVNLLWLQDRLERAVYRKETIDKEPKFGVNWNLPTEQRLWLPPA